MSVFLPDFIMLEYNAYGSVLVKLDPHTRHNVLRRVSTDKGSLEE